MRRTRPTAWKGKLVIPTRLFGSRSTCEKTLIIHMFINWSCRFLCFFNILIVCVHILVCESSAAPWAALWFFFFLLTFRRLFLRSEADPLGLVVCKGAPVVGGKQKKNKGQRVQRDCSLLIIYLVTVYGVDGLNQHTWDADVLISWAWLPQKVTEDSLQIKQKRILCVDMSTMSYDWNIICLGQRAHTHTYI